MGTLPCIEMQLYLTALHVLLPSKQLQRRITAVLSWLPDLFICLTLYSNYSSFPDRLLEEKDFPPKEKRYFDISV